MRRSPIVIALVLAAVTPLSCSSSSTTTAESPDASVDAGDASSITMTSPDAGVVSHPLCVNGVSVDGAYPKVPLAIAVGSTIPNLAFSGLDSSGAPHDVALTDYFEPCAAKSRLLVMRASAAWCGTCRYELSHTGALLSKSFGVRLRLLDLLIADEDNNPAAQSDLAAQRARIDAPQTLAADPGHVLRAVTDAKTGYALPLIVLVDSKTMRIMSYLSNPDPASEQAAIESALASLDGVVAPGKPTQTLVDGQWTPNQWALLQETTVPAAPPPDPTNEKADDAAAAAFGKSLFFDKTLSPNGEVSCVRCHLFNKGTSDTLPESSVGLGQGDRNATALALASFSRWQFWDGRADSLWSQATAPFEAPKEFGGTRLFVAHQIFGSYKATYESIWTKYPMPDLTDTVRFPPSGKPGDAAWEAMAPADKDAVTRILVNVAKSIAAYERTIRVQPMKLDAYVGGNFSAFSSDEKAGLVAFVTKGCQQCHWGPRLTDDAFHVKRMLTGRQDGLADLGRIDVLPAVFSGEFISTSAYSDSKTTHSGLAHLAATTNMLGAFKTPTLRGVVESAPYDHGGREPTLAAIAQLLQKGGLAANDARSAGTSESWLVPYDDATEMQLFNFLNTLTANAAAP